MCVPILVTPMKLQPHSWKCDPIQRDIPISLLLGSTPGIYSWGQDVWTSKVLFFCGFTDRRLSRGSQKCRKRTKPISIAILTKQTWQTKNLLHDQVRPTARLPCPSGHDRSTFAYENKRRSFFNFKFGCRTELLIIISPNIFFFKGSR